MGRKLNFRSFWQVSRAAFGIIGLISLSTGTIGCSEAEVEDRAPDYRYRLTVEVDTPEGVKTGSSVIEVQQGIGRTTMDGFGEVIMYKVRGEAVAVDLPDGQTLYALLRTGSDVDWATRVIPFLTPDQGDENPLDDVLLMKGKQELPRMWPPVGHIEARPAYPMLVTFGDEADPTSVTLIDPDDLAAIFGKGVSLSCITAELTNDSVTIGIEERLRWLKKVGRERSTLKPNPPKYLSDTQPIDRVSPRDFAKGLFQ